MSRRSPIAAPFTGALLAAALLGGCELGPKQSTQTGYRGTGMATVQDRDAAQASLAANQVPAPHPPAGEGPPAQWQNVQVLTDISTTEFNRTMLAITQWVSPEQGCVYCHSPRNFAADTAENGEALYAKLVARRMLQMTRDVNANYRGHVGQQGVTCYTCHRGLPVPPAGLWTYTDENQYLRFLLDRPDARVQTPQVNPSNANRSSIKQTENTYGIMIAMSNALGVNCTYCHTSRSWAEWQNAPPTRVVALHGLRMTRDLNQEYIVPLNTVLPANRLGALGDAPKIQCLTCHQGVARPLYGAMLAQYYPGLWGHPGPWESRIASDTALAGITDLRRADGLPREDSPRLGPMSPGAYPAGTALPAGRRRQAIPIPVDTTRALGAPQVEAVPADSGGGSSR